MSMDTVHFCLSMEAKPSCVLMGIKDWMVSQNCFRVDSSLPSRRGHNIFLLYFGFRDCLMDLTEVGEMSERVKSRRSKLKVPK